VGRRHRQREKPKAPPADYRDAEGNVLTLRGSLTPAARREYADVLQGGLNREDAWQRATELLFERLGLNKRESKDMVEAFFDLIYATLLSGDDVKMSGFGNFNIRRKAPRPGRNPRTGEAIPIKARHVVTFHASHKLKGVVQGDTPVADDFE